ncbi:hypothetical protein DZA37_01115 [Kangiella sp. HD9-110m-PIT-SAG06]|nr:hypothetical protein DZA37_01115 [Kangiella sp. HD9-110m-PIT-SAG06]
MPLVSFATGIFFFSSLCEVILREVIGGGEAAFRAPMLDLIPKKFNNDPNMVLISLPPITILINRSKFAIKSEAVHKNVHLLGQVTARFLESY